MVQFTALSKKRGCLYRIYIRTSEVREVIENADGTTTLRLSDIRPNGGFSAQEVVETYEEVVKIIESDQRGLSRIDYLSRIDRERKNNE